MKFFLLPFLAASLLAYCPARADEPGVVDVALPSEIPGITVPNSHWVSRPGPGGMIVRGGSPNGRVAELRRFGLNEVIIYKKEVKNEVKAEVREWSQSGLPPQAIHVVPLSWPDLQSFSETCNKTMSALTILLQAVHTPGRNVYFHCTAGEDRTGFLAGLFRIYQDGWDVNRTFQGEMCENGYESGDPTKPGPIVADIQKELTPDFLRLAYLLQKARANHWALTPEICGPAAEREAQQALRSITPQVAARDYTCRISPKYPPGGVARVRSGD